jgi:STE24 endopeptidase
VLRILVVSSLASQLLVLVALVRARRALAARLLGPTLVRAALLGASVALALRLAALPFGLIGLWWRRHEDVARAGYGRYLLDLLLPAAAELALGALAAAALVLLSRRLGRRWWLAAWGVLVAFAAAWVLAGPALLAPRLQPLRDEALAADIRALGARLGLDDVDVQVREARRRTRAVNAEAVGIGPSTTVVLWDTLLQPGVGRGEVRFIAAHELAHVSRRHPEKGVAWFALLALPAAWLLARVTRLREPADVPLAALVVALVALALTPLANAVSRRYEREADWVSLRITGEAAGAEALFERFVRVSKSDPDPPPVWHAVMGTHPTLIERIALARSRVTRAAAPPAGPGSPSSSSTWTTSPASRRAARS